MIPIEQRLKEIKDKCAAVSGINAKLSSEYKINISKLCLKDVPMLLEMVDALYAMVKCNHEHTEEMMWITSRLNQIMEKYK